MHKTKPARPPPADHQQLHDLFRHVALGVALFDEQGRMEYANAALAKILHCPHEDILKRKLEELLPRGKVAGLHQSLTQLIKGPHSNIIQEQYFTQPEGKTLGLRIYLALIQGPEHPLNAHVIGLFEDLNQQTPSSTKSESMLRCFLSAIPDAIFSIDQQGLITHCNERALKLFGYQRDELIGQALSLLIPPSSRVKHDDLFKAFILAPKKQAMHERPILNALHKDGHEFPVEISLDFDQHGGDTFAVCAIRDIRERLKHEDKISLAAAVFKSSHEALLVISKDGEIEEVNPAFETISGFCQEDVIGQPFENFVYTGRHTADSILNAPIAGQQDIDLLSLHEAFKHGQAWHGELQAKHKNGHVYTQKLSLSHILNHDESVSSHIILFSDISEKKQQEERIWQQANFDQLTKLPNRHMFFDRLDIDLKKAHRAKQTLALLFIDLDHFKEVNDNFGHQHGDELLIQVAQRINTCVRDSDTVGRIGGDEFTVIVSPLVNGHVSTVERICGKLIDSLCQPFEIRGETLEISACIGIALYPSNACSCDELYKCADSAMYKAKSSGRNRFVFFQSSADTTKA